MVQVFSCEFWEISKNTFFTEHLWTTACAFSFSEAATGSVLETSQNSQENTFGLRNFKKHLFYRTPLDDCFWLFWATLLKCDAVNSVWKTSDEYADLETLTLEVTFRYMISFFRRINFQCVFINLHCLLPEAAIRVEVFCKKRCS